MWLMHWLLYFSLITDILYSCNRTVGCNRTPVIGKIKQPIIISPLRQIYQSQANHRIITIATTTYPTNLGNFQNGGIFYIRQCFYQRCFPNVNFEVFPPFFAQSDNCSLVELSSSLEETQPTVAGTWSMPTKMQQTDASQIPISEELQQQRSTLVESVSGISLQLGPEDQSRFPVVPNDEIIEINESAAGKNTKRTTQTWLTAWEKWCQARNIDNTMERFTPRVLDEILTKFFVEVWKKDGTEYEPDSLRITQASLDSYLRRKIMRHPSLAGESSRSLKRL